jgi:methionyl-tRNA formyltransferase
VKLRAVEAGIPVLQPSRLREPGWPERLREFNADVAVVVAFGQILPRAVLDVPRRGSINVHGSLLPRYRGAAPIAWAIMRGETETGITTFQMDEGMDTGPMLLRVPTPIAPDATAGELATQLAVLGADVLIDTLARLDRLTPTPQRHEDATLAPRLQKADGHIDWRRSARDIVNLVRGCNPWPGATTLTPRETLTIWRASEVEAHGAAGTLVGHEDALAIAAGRGAISPLEVRPENRRTMPWMDYLRGARLSAGARFTTP